LSRIWIVSNRNPLGYPLDWLQSRRGDCEVHTLSEIEADPTIFQQSVPDMLVFDVGSFPMSTDPDLERFMYRSPSIPVIAVRPKNMVASRRFLEQFTADEVIVHDLADNRQERTAESLLAKIEVLDRITTVQLRLRKEMNESRIIAQSKPMRDVLQRLPNLASSMSSVLITGETGTGKELIARAIHYLGTRAGKPFITVDCGSIPDTLIENELFGHIRGAYTDANTAARGLIQEAEGGSVFLDEVEALPLNVQSRFLRILQERQVRPLGQTKYSLIDVRIISSTNGNLRDFIERRQFREDLYYRLNVIPLYLPPLRNRRSDIPDLVRYFVNRHARGGQLASSIPDDLMTCWLKYDWPGNVRELENRVQEWLAIPETLRDSIPVEGETCDLLPPLAEVRRQALDQRERLYFLALLSKTNGNISAASRIAHIDRKNLRVLLRKHAIDPMEFRS